MIKLSIITVCYNSEKTIEETIKSIVLQKTDNVEYIIVDGKSTDHTLEIIEKYKDTIDVVISEKDEGISDAFNKGIRSASGEYIGIINSDDMLIPGAIRNLMHDLDGSADIIYGDGIRLFEDNTCKPFLSDENPKNLHKNMSFCHPAVFVKKRAYDNWGLFSNNYKCVMDRELLLRFLKAGATFRYTRKYYAVYRMGGMSDSQYFKCVLPETKRIEIGDGLSIFEANLKYFRRVVIYFLILVRSKMNLDTKRQRFDAFLKTCIGDM